MIDLIERVKHVEFELLKANDEIKQRDDKVGYCLKNSLIKIMLTFLTDKTLGGRN